MLHYELFLYLGLLLLFGFLMGRIADKARLPEITGYIVAGLLIGPNVLGLIDHDAIPGLNVITSLVLAIIAYQIGTELWFPKLKQHGVKILVMTLIHALIVAIVVFLAVWAISSTLWLAFALASLAVASAPAPIMVIIQKLRAKGPLTKTVVPFVGILDIISVVMFGFLSTIAVSVLTGEEINVQNAFYHPILEVVLSIGIGGVFGLLLGLASKFVVCKYCLDDQYTAYLVLSMIAILFSVWIAEAYALSLILMPMSAGMVFTNFIGKATFKLQYRALSNFEKPFIILFFAVVGLELSPGVLQDAGLIALAFITFRMIGKLLGAYVGAVITRASLSTKRYIGFSLLPQGGVTIGMLVALTAMLPDEEARIVQTIILASILFFEIVGPIVFKSMISRSGESRA